MRLTILPFFRITQYIGDTHNARTLIPMNTRKSYPRSALKVYSMSEYNLYAKRRQLETFHTQIGPTLPLTTDPPSYVFGSV
jgi:hypothetical protein